jgi:hypothetical protein
LKSSIFICSLLHDAVSNLDSIASNDWKIVNNELLKMWTEEVMICFKVHSHHLPGGIEENHENLLVRIIPVLAEI